VVPCCGFCSGAGGVCCRGEEGLDVVAESSKSLT